MAAKVSSRGASLRILTQTPRRSNLPHARAIIVTRNPLPVLYLAPNRWHGPRQRTQHLAAGLARSRRVVFVEPAANSLPGNLRRRLAGRPTLPWRARYTQLTGSLAVFTPAPTIPGSLHLRPVNRVIHYLAWRQFRRLAPEISGGDVDIVVAWPPAVDLALRFRTRRLVYDCLDLFPAFYSGARSRLMARLEAELARRAAAILVPSRRLEQRWTGRHRHVARIPNGVELERFLPAPAAPPVPDDLRTFPSPRLGYIGTVGTWLDLPLLTHVAHHRPNCSIVLIGPLEPDMSIRRGPTNLHLLGERPYTDLPAYLAAMDVLLIPFRVTELTRAVNPIKLYEYCATGKPIVATPLDEVVAASGLCHLGDGPEGFLAAVDAALAEASAPDLALAAARQAFAGANTWDRRVAALVQCLDQLG